MNWRVLTVREVGLGCSYWFEACSFVKFRIKRDVYPGPRLHEVWEVGGVEGCTTNHQSACYWALLEH